MNEIIVKPISERITGYVIQHWNSIKPKIRAFFENSSLHLDYQNGELSLNGNIYDFEFTLPVGRVLKCLKQEGAEESTTENT